MPKASATTSATSSAASDLHASVSAPPASYELAMQELERLVASLESGELPLDQLLSGYQRGATLLQYCRTQLQAVEDQIKVLDDGVLKPWRA